MPLCKKSDAVTKKGELKKGYYTRIVKKEGKEDRIMYFAPNVKKEKPKADKVDKKKMRPSAKKEELIESVPTVTESTQ